MTQNSNPEKAILCEIDCWRPDGSYLIVESVADVYVMQEAFENLEEMALNVIPYVKTYRKWRDGET